MKDFVARSFMDRSKGSHHNEDQSKYMEGGKLNYDQLDTQRN